jgi:hypothetical protein
VSKSILSWWGRAVRTPVGDALVAIGVLGLMMGVSAAMLLGCQLLYHAAGRLFAP